MRNVWCLLLLLPSVGLASWPTRGHNVRRSGQSEVLGPGEVGRVLSFKAPEGISINIAPTISSSGAIYFGTWGVIRSHGEEDHRLWDKLDGKLYQLDITDLSQPWGGPFEPDPVPYCYDYQRRSDPGYCPSGGMVSWYNGTVEGTAVLSQDEQTVYVGRGDGKLYAVDVATGTKKWAFTTFNPVDPQDPDGGGEIIGGPLLTPRGQLFFATVKAGPYETNALYGVDVNGQLLWRYPQAEASLPHILWASPALSPDGKTVYFTASWGPAVDERDSTIPGTLYAVDISGETPQIKWTFDPVDVSTGTALNVWTYLMVVGSDGTLYAGGTRYAESWGEAVVFAVKDQGDHGELVWSRFVGVDEKDAATVYGLALREEQGVSTHVYAGSGNGYGIAGYPSGGELISLDPGTGHIQWAFDPTTAGEGGALTGISVDAAGNIYAGASGLGDSGGTVFSLDPTGSLRWTYTLGGLLEWGHPVLGPGGEVVVAESRRCFWYFQPIESGLCDGVDIDPALYVIYPGEGGDDGGGCSTRGQGCSQASSQGVGPGMLLFVAGLMRWRRRGE